jgi:hypothetical protein
VQVTRIEEYIEERQTRDEHTRRTQRLTIQQNPVSIIGMGTRRVLTEGVAATQDNDFLRKKIRRELTGMQAALIAQMAAITEVQQERAGDV